MTITNHLLAGSLIGLAIKEPLLAAVLALASHFVMDALPHFGYPGRKGYSEVLKYRLTYIVSVATLLTSVSVIIWLLAHGEYFALGMGLVAVSPDAVGLYNYLAYKGMAKKPQGC